MGIAETTRRLLRGRIEFTYNALRGGEQWHIACDGDLLCGGSSCWTAHAVKGYVPGETELPMPMCYKCFLVFNSPTVVVLR